MRMQLACEHVRPPAWFRSDIMQVNEVLQPMTWRAAWQVHSDERSVLRLCGFCFML